MGRVQHWVLLSSSRHRASASAWQVGTQMRLRENPEKTNAKEKEAQEDERKKQTTH
jgi:hypothetical protein